MKLKKAGTPVVVSIETTARETTSSTIEIPTAPLGRLEKHVRIIVAMVRLTEL
jgi:hypothetical protein